MTNSPNPTSESPWQRIETAPRDGTRVLGLLLNVEIVIARWAHDHWEPDFAVRDLALTKWQPLPNLPDPAQ